MSDDASAAYRTGGHSVYTCALCLGIGRDFGARDSNVDKTGGRGGRVATSTTTRRRYRVCTSSISLCECVCVCVCVSSSRERNATTPPREIKTASGGCRARGRAGFGRRARCGGGKGEWYGAPSHWPAGLSRAPTDASGGRAGARGANAIDVAAVAVPRDRTVQSWCCSGGVATASTDTRRWRLTVYRTHRT